MRRKKSFNKLTGHYFFNIKAGYQKEILISRKTKEEAAYAFKSYVKQRKECEWLGKWDGKEYTDTDFINAA